MQRPSATASFIFMPSIININMDQTSNQTVSKTMTEKERFEYQLFVKRMSDNNDSGIFYNSSPDHAVIVIAQIFRRSKDTVRIFAKNLCRTIGNIPEYISALSDFIERNGKVRILLNGFDEECAKSSNLYKRLAYYKSIGKDIIVKTTTAVPYRASDEEKKEVHFTLGDNDSYRMETNIAELTAECCMNNVEFTQETVEFFDGMFNDENAKEVNLLELFGYDE